MANVYKIMFDKIMNIGDRIILINYKKLGLKL